MTEHKYTFDVTLAAIVHVRATSAPEARCLIAKFLDCVPLIINPDEVPEPEPDFAITEASASLDDADGPVLLEIDGKEIEA